MDLGDQLPGLCDLLCRADRPEVRTGVAAGLSMIFTQGALGYGLTSIMGAVVLEIFQGRQYGSIFGTIMLAALAGGAAGPWATGLCTIFRAATR